MARKRNIIKRIYSKLFVWHWKIGFFHGTIEEIIRTKSFNPDIQWIQTEPSSHFFADPFFLEKDETCFQVMAEDFRLKDNYAKLSLLTFDKKFNLIAKKELLDTKSHLSYPFIHRENNEVYVFPEAGKSGKLSCYQYDSSTQTLNFLKTIIDLPVMDPTILKHNSKYWIFGTLSGKTSRKNLMIFYSKDLMGPYKQHPKNPITNSLKGSRSAGSFINVDGVIYRPAQNCENHYGESITINKLKILDEMNYEEEPYMEIASNRENNSTKNTYSIHTINVLGRTITVDGQDKSFQPIYKIKNWIFKSFKRNKNRRA